MHTYVPTYLPTYLTTYRPTYMDAYIHADIQTCIHTYLHTYIPTYIHTERGYTKDEHDPFFELGLISPVFPTNSEKQFRECPKRLALRSLHWGS